MHSSSDTRIPLPPLSQVELSPDRRYIIDRFLSGDSLSLLYLAHREEDERYVTLRELYPRNPENAFAQRLEDGKVLIWNALSGPDDADSRSLTAELENALRREAEQTRKAGIGTEGPFADSRGNLYLELEVCPEESLGQYLDRSFLRGRDGQPESNPLLSGILPLLAEAAGILNHTGLLHLDLSPENIFLTVSRDSDGPRPCILGFGRREPVVCPFLTNPHADPQVAARAACDVYSLASILFYAATGRIFTPALRTSPDVWKAQILREYASGPDTSRESDPFATSLIALLEKGLAEDPRDRFPTPGAFRDALLELGQKLSPSGNLLRLVPRDELMSYLVLEKHPLYRYRNADGSIHVLCLGSGVFAKRMILSLISCGQIIDSRLHIHIVSNGEESELREFLISAAPELAHYSNLTGETDREYVTFHYDRVTDLLDPDTCRTVLMSHSQARYLLISLGSTGRNAAAAGLYANALAHTGRQDSTVINYYCAGDFAQPLPGADRLPDWLETDAFGDDLASYTHTLQQLGRRTLRLAHLYNKLGNPRISLTETARMLIRDAYGQRSSCAAALHLNYKLAGVGICPETTGKADIITAYRQVLESGQYGRLLRNEHDRWMMYMIAEQYRCPTTEELRRYGYAMNGETFNAAWRSKEPRLHPCLVPCSDAGIVLKPEDWKTRNTEASIQESPFDPLDKVSLLLHLLSEEKCREILRQDSIGGAFGNLANKLDRALASAPVSGESGDTLPLEVLRLQLRTVREALTTAARNLQDPGDLRCLTELRNAFSAAGIDAAGEITTLERKLSVFREYAAHKDYKSPDEAIIRNLPWLLYADDDMTLIKLKGKTIADNITGPLILEPRELVFFGTRQEPQWLTFLHSHGYFGRTAFVPCGAAGVDALYRELNGLVARQNRPCVIDITGADEAAVVAAHRICGENSRVSMIRSHPDGRMENIHAFPTASIYTLNTTITAEEIYGLQGAARNAEESHYMEQLGDLAPALWQVYQEFKDDWNMVTAFFHARGSGSSELWIRNIRIDAGTRWQRYSRRVDKAKWNALELGDTFRKMADAGILLDYSVRESMAGRLDVIFRYPLISTGVSSDFMLGALNAFFDYKMAAAMAPFRCEITHSPMNGFTVSVSSGCRVDIFERVSTEYTDTRYQTHGGRTRYAYSQVVPALKRMAELGLILDLRTPDYPDCLPIRISFVYPNPAIRNCLATAGNALELYIWHEARRMRFFDDVQSNFSFAWREGVSNELDVILTKGLTSLIISAKSARYNKEHLYEIKYLTERFSLNSKSVIVYSSDRAFLDGRLTTNLLPVKNRARAMGVYLIDMNELECTLGEKLVRIAMGLDQP